jgi:hypothetical protein
MSNNILTSSVIAKEALTILENNLVFAKSINRKYEKEFAVDRKIGDTVTIRKPAQYTVRTGKTLSVQDHTEASTTVTVGTQKGVDVNFSSKELALDIGEFSDQVLKPQLAALANDIDLDCLTRAYQRVGNSIGTPGTTPSAYKTYLQAGQKMSEFAAPLTDRRMLVNPAAQVEILDGTKGLFQASSELADQYRDAQMGRGAGFDWLMSQNIPTHTVGPLGGTPLTNGVPTSGATSIATDGWTAAAAARLKAGDVVTFDGVYAVNPVSKVAMPFLKQFVVTEDISSTSGGAADVKIYPAMISTGTQKNVSALPADGAAVKIFGDPSASAGKLSPANLAYHKDAFTLVTVDLPVPKGMDMAERMSSRKLGLSLRFIRGFDITNDLYVSRFDILYGFGDLYPEWACRVQG